MFDKILIANRGEIALRILRAAKELGIATVAVHSTADADAMHVRLADESVCIGPPAARDSYLNIPSIIAACEITGADAVHPGYGFPSENARFAEVLAHHQIGFIGPKAQHIRTMGDKIEAKRTALKLGIPCVPGSEGGVEDADTAKRVAAEIGYPVLVKAAAGARRPRHEGGGVPRPSWSRRSAWPSPRRRPPSGTTRSISRSTWRSRATSRSRCSATAAAVPCTSPSATAPSSAATRRSGRKAASPALNESMRAEIGGICANAMKELGYLGAGTIEFLYEDGAVLLHRDEYPYPGRASGHRDDHRDRPRHRADPGRLGRPALGEPGGHQGRGPRHRVPDQRRAPGDSSGPRPARSPTTTRPAASASGSIPAAFQGYRIPPNYDLLIGKLIVHGRTRNECLMRLRRALDEFVIDGIDTTLPLFRTLVRNPDVQNGLYDIHWLEHFLEDGGMKA